MIRKREQLSILKITNPLTQEDSMSSFCFELDQKVAITASAETGRVIGRAVEAWWSEDALQPC